MKEDEIYLSIVIPAYKEEERIHLILDAISTYQKHHDFAIETIVVVDGSPDNTAATALKYENKLPNLTVIDRKENHGKGYSVKEGVLKAKGKYVLFADADNSTPVEQADKLLEFAESYDVVIGSRYCPNGKLARPQPIHRIIGSRVLNMIIQALAIAGIRDTQCGFKLFESKVAKEVFKRQTFERFSFDIELLAIAKRLGYSIKEVGITWYDNPHSTVNPIKDGLRMIRDAWQVRKNIVAGLYR
ncbi:MAG: Undecaprenyl-phosphate 4-deoxy-4-formamido-L-arabinose transferase [bacterium ADurb.Bin400]|nr:MAG: Undecaprenyl-phosphate 4-deoxy-4-formamido-L-arabinose transferase [bacterium ADurb.Bin400]